MTTQDAASVLGPRSSLAALIVAPALISVVAVLLAASFGALIFSAPLPDHVGDGVAMMLFSIAIVAAVTAAASSLRGSVAGPQDNTSIVLAVMTASIAASAPATMPSDALFATVVAAIALASLLTGAVFFVLGHLRAGDLVRYIPYPVIGGFLGGTGWLLVVGGFDVLTGQAVAAAQIGELLTADLLLRWLPAVLVAAALVWTVRRSQNLLAVPGALIASIAAFYGVLLATGTSLADARADGWLLGPFPDATWPPLGPTALRAADWGLISAEAGSIATLVMIATVSLLLNASGVEIATASDGDLNQELRIAGLASMFSGVGGGAVGYTWASVTALAHRLGAAQRSTGLIVAGICAAVLFAGLEVFTFVPVPVVGALLVFLGLVFLTDWLLDGWSTLPRGDYLVVVLIIAAIALVGLLEGVVFGIALALVIFVIRYSRTDVVKHRLDVTVLQSRVDRHPREQRVLQETGDRVMILELQGFVFFGTATGVQRLVEERAGQAPPLSCVVLDFRRVSGVDSSATLSLVKLHRRIAGSGADLVLTAATDGLRQQLHRGGLRTSDGGALPAFTDLDHGIEWCEERLLEATLNGAGSWAAPPPICPAADTLAVPRERLEPYLERRSLPADAVLIHQGAASAGLTLIESGRVTAMLAGDDGDRVRLRTMRAGTVIGELSFFLQRPATADVVADTPVQAAELSSQAMEAMERDDPDLAAALHRALITMLGERLVSTDRLVQSLRD